MDLDSHKGGGPHVGLSENSLQFPTSSVLLSLLPGSLIVCPLLCLTHQLSCFVYSFWLAPILPAIYSVLMMKVSACIFHNPEQPVGSGPMVYWILWCRVWEGEEGQMIWRRKGWRRRIKVCSSQKHIPVFMFYRGWPSFFSFIFF